MVKLLASTPRIIDCFCFFRELDFLEIRLRELSEIVDRFVLVENIWDFAGNPKPLFFQQNKHLFEDYLGRIEHIIVEDRPHDEGERFAFQHLQRDHIVRGLGDVDGNDLVLISDVDEIPTIEALEAAQQILTSKDAFIIFLMRHHALRLNLKSPGMVITGSRMTRRARLRSPHVVRRLKRAYWKKMPDWLDQIPAMFNAFVATGRPLRRYKIDDAGWHLNSMGNADLLDAKWASFKKDERGIGDVSWAESIGSMLEGDTEVAAAMGLERVPLSELPKTIADDPARYAHLIDQAEL